MSIRRGNFTGPQPVCRQQQQHRVIGPAAERTLVNARPDLFDLIPIDRSGDAVTFPGTVRMAKRGTQHAASTTAKPQTYIACSHQPRVFTLAASARALPTL